MRSVAITLTVLLVPAWAQGQELPEVAFYVDAAAAPGGPGTRKAPFVRIADALDAGRPLAATHEVTIKVLPGDYGAEPRPLSFDYRVNLKGPTVLLRDADGIATGGFEKAATIQGTAVNLPMIRITGAGVAIRGLRLTGGGTDRDGVRGRQVGRLQDPGRAHLEHRARHQT